MKTTAITLAATLISFGAAHAADRVDLGLGAGVLSDRLSGEVKITQRVYMSGGLAGVDADDDIRYSGARLALEPDMRGGVGAVEVRPFGNGVYIAAGAHIGRKTYLLSGAAAPEMQLGSSAYAAGDIGAVRGAIDIEGATPYWSCGVKHSFARDRIDFNLSVAALYVSDASVNLYASGGARSGDKGLRADLREAEKALRRSVVDSPLYPIASLGLKLKF